ncbi:MAG: sugar phosphate isomerase/epimerase [Candidatus Marinimicrobia bacterium]|jgi:sugar phosphate isomerase/epimerase|nr:sugar phosphate isomerase/epimerase [Candidatus Neomarinimicrobiota bacterium]MBT3840181.1 sugar phosphate isomerase/epimerase [Candidatus Neomarinimicrobiota bacterium]MBT3999175.1 sugar phosphate isomerase/epimerase [Candidatus Neomarinimicrobiota bacterium]MBT4282611.1 sugar phosphate isomerase/epimerase [Candidatus Neomarinimicrobiota bacterium]MBT4579707.1 sugar phosphate isomerase/epimerase [Candidatus Neomarinimicrobiota bacterium]
MSRPITLFTGQWADLPIDVLAEKAASWGYEGLELACWGDHLDVNRAAVDLDYCEVHLAKLEKHNLKVHAISNHLAGQLVCDLNDARSNSFAPDECAGDPEKKRAWGVEQMKLSAQAAKNLGIDVVNGFTGSSIWHYFYSFPSVTQKTLDEGYEYFAKMWNPILDVFDECGVKFALEVHPTEIAFDIVTAERAIQAVNGRKAFGFNFDPSHLHWQMVDPVRFIYEFKDRIYHCHMKDAAFQLDGRTGILGSHLDFGDSQRGWDFRSLGRGDIDFEEIIRAFNHIEYNGPLSVEWEDMGMEREQGAEEACNFVRQLDFKRSGRAFDSAFEE